VCIVLEGILGDRKKLEVASPAPALSFSTIQSQETVTTAPTPQIASKGFSPLDSSENTPHSPPSVALKFSPVIAQHTAPATPTTPILSFSSISSQDSAPIMAAAQKLSFAPVQAVFTEPIDGPHEQAGVIYPSVQACDQTRIELADAKAELSDSRDLLLKTGDYYAGELTMWSKKVAASDEKHRTVCLENERLVTKVTELEKRLTHTLHISNEEDGELIAAIKDVKVSIVGQTKGGAGIRAISVKVDCMKLKELASALTVLMAKTNEAFKTAAEEHGCTLEDLQLATMLNAKL
jgi:hypothetical protein